MNPFLEIPIIYPSIDQSKIVTARIRPGEIEYYNELPDGGCQISMKSGLWYNTPLSFADFDQYLFTFYEYTRKNVGKFGNLVVNIPKPTDKVALKVVPKEEETPLQTENN